MPAALPDKTRRSRITAACAVCRAKRQKCSGSKPACDQCLHNNEQCWWSDQKKRGPAKDYLRSLQDRLQETERLLLGVLGHVSDESLIHVLQNEPAAPSHHTWTSSLSGQDYWSHHPMDRTDSIRQWQRERGVHHAMPTSADMNASSRDSVGQSQPPIAIDPSLSSTVKRVPQDHIQPNPIPHNGSQDPVPLSLAHDPAVKVPLERRYSDETRDVAKTLFSISHNGENLKRKHESEDHVPYQAQDQSTPLEDIRSKFPKHLFW